MGIELEIVSEDDTLWDPEEERLRFYYAFREGREVTIRFEMGRLPGIRCSTEGVEIRVGRIDREVDPLRWAASYVSAVDGREHTFRHEAPLAAAKAMLFHWSEEG